MAFTQLPPLSLYIHIPWCVQKCPYCDFNSHQVKQPIPQQAYVNRLLSDLEQALPSVWGRSIISIFIGGGTPSLFEPQYIDQLLSGIRALIPFNADIEITLEANPGTVEASKFKGFYDAGINRISIGVQSFDDNFLKSLGRIHDSDEAIKAYQIAREAGFKNINIDLMYGLPKQSIKQALQDLSIAIELAPEHLSWYQLTLEPNTLFYKQPPPLPNDDLIIDMSSQGIDLLNQANYQQYEVSAYSRKGRYPSEHNMNYWQFGDYLGIGAGAHQKITRADQQSITRTSKRRSPKDYLNLDKRIIDNSNQLNQQELPLEFMLNALRLKNGFVENLFHQHSGLLLADIEKTLVQAESQGLLIRDDGRIIPSEQGYLFLNDLLTLFLPENYPHLASKENITIKNIS